MARSLKQIQQELDSIKQTVSESAEELESLYDRYIACLSESAQKQLILATYQLCTQIYPETFLELSLSQRQKLQQTVRSMGKEMQPLLEKKPTAEDLNQEKADLSLIAEMLKKLPWERVGNKNPGNSDSDDEVSDATNSDDESEELIASLEIPTEEAEDKEQENPRSESTIEEIKEFSFEELKSVAEGEVNVSKIQEIDLSNPHHLIMWHKGIEGNLRKTLDNTSRKINNYLQENSIIPNRLPAKVMEIALKAGDNAGGNNKIRKIPNILDIVIETEKGKKNQKSHATPVSLIRLRLLEIEFAEPRLSSQRNEIRGLVKKVKKLENLYQKKEQEYMIAEADAAWRSSWYEG